MLRRFANFQIGALDANRLNEMLAAIVRLEQRVMMMPMQQERNKDVILARITGEGVKAGYELCQGAVRCVSYPFEEVGLAIQQPGPISGDTCVQTDRIEGGLSSDGGAFLLMIEGEPTLKPQDVVKAHLASRADRGTASDKGMVYIGTAVGKSDGVVTGEVISASPSGYLMEIDGTGERVDVLNLYEAAAYYGAMDEQPECAALSPLPIPDGSRIWAFQYRSEWFTCIPTAFSVACTCNDDATGAGAARALASIESKAASAMLNLGRTIY